MARRNADNEISNGIVKLIERLRPFRLEQTGGEEEGAERCIGKQLPY